MSLTILETAAQREPVSQNQYRVFFRVQHGAGATGVRAIDVAVASSQEEPYKLAELLAIKYLLLHTTHAGMNRTGKSLQLNVSSGAIRKTRYDSDHQYRYASQWTFSSDSIRRGHH